MSSALDRFERSLVAASRALAATVGTVETAAATDAEARLGGGLRRRPLHWLRSLGLVAQVAVAVVSLSACAGVAVAAYVVFKGGPARLLPAFECQMSDGLDAIAPAVTGSPLVDCAAAWPQASGGREAAPPLAIWGADDGQRLVAVAAPVSAGPPPGDDHYHWQRLPDSWTVDLPVVALTDQLDNISLPFNSGATNACSYAGSDIAAVRALLRTDELSGWRVTLRAQNGRQLASGCRTVFVANVDARDRTVSLLQASPSAGAVTTGAPTSGSGHTQALAGSAAAAYGQLERLYAGVNATLDAGCESVTAATALWTRAAGAAGFTPTTLAFWDEVNAHQPDPETFFQHYTLYQQPASQQTGSCAHVLVIDVGGSGIANVYVARIAP